MDSKIQANAERVLPEHVAIIGAAGGLGHAIVDVCRTDGIPFTAIVRSRPERIGEIPTGSRVDVVTSLADRAALANAFRGASVVISAMGVTSGSQDASALHSVNMPTIEAAMQDAGVGRIIIVNTLLSAAPGKRPSRAMRFFSMFPGNVGRGAREQRAVVDALGNGSYSSLAWTLVRAGVNIRGQDERPAASLDWNEKVNSWQPVSYHAMARWMLEEAAANRYVHEAPFVSLARNT